MKSSKDDKNALGNAFVIFISTVSAILIWSGIEILLLKLKDVIPSFTSSIQKFSPAIIALITAIINFCIEKLYCKFMKTPELTIKFLDNNQRRTKQIFFYRDKDNLFSNQELRIEVEMKVNSFQLWIQKLLGVRVHIAFSPKELDSELKDGILGSNPKNKCYQNKNGDLILNTCEIFSAGANKGSAYYDFFFQPRQPANVEIIISKKGKLKYIPLYRFARMKIIYPSILLTTKER